MRAWGSWSRSGGTRWWVTTMPTRELRGSWRSAARATFFSRCSPVPWRHIETSSPALAWASAAARMSEATDGDLYLMGAACEWRVDSGAHEPDTAHATRVWRLALGAPHVHHKGGSNRVSRGHSRSVESGA